MRWGPVISILLLLSFASLSAAYATAAGPSPGESMPREMDFAWALQYMTPGPVSAMVALNPTRAWAASSGNIYVFNGSKWKKQFSSGSGSDVSTMSAFDTRHVWAAGRDEAGGNVGGSAIYFCNGSGWARQNSLPVDVNGIAALGNGRALAVGSTGGAVKSRGIAYYFNGKSWAKQFETGEALNAVSPADASRAWAVGDRGGIYFFDGAHWARRYSAGGRLACVSALDASYVIAGGTAQPGSSSARAAVYAFNGNQWLKVGAFGGSAAVGSIASVDPYHTWAASDAIYTYNGSFWRAQYHAPRDFRPTCIAGCDIYRVWAGDGGGGIYFSVNVSNIVWMFPHEILR